MRVPKWYRISSPSEEFKDGMPTSRMPFRASQAHGLLFAQPCLVGRYAKMVVALVSDLQVWHAFNAVRLTFAILAWLVLASEETTQPARAVINYEYEYKRENSNSAGKSSGLGSIAQSSA